MTEPRSEVAGLRFLGPLGSGGMGEVELAEDLSTGRRVAVKWFSTVDAAGVAGVERFLREARTLARLDHPHLVKVHRLGELDGRPYMVLELVEGGSLGDRLAERGRLHPAEAMAVTRQAVEGLAAAWGKGIVHRDIKPSNLMFDAASRIKVVDFGLALSCSADEEAARLTRTGFIVGSPHYMSPEQIRGEPLDVRSDLYSLGTVLFEMLTGRPPFEGRSQGAILAGHLTEDPPDLEELRPELPEEVIELVRRLIAKDPSERPASAQEVLGQLDRCESGLAGRVARGPGGAARPRLDHGRRWVLFALLALAGVAAVVLARTTRDVPTAIVAAAPPPAFHGDRAVSRRDIGSLGLSAGATGREVAGALEARATPGLDVERRSAGGLGVRLNGALHPLLIRVALDGSVSAFPSVAAASDGLLIIPSPLRSSKDGWLVLVATERPLEPPPVLGARPEGRSVIYPAVLDGASGTIHPAHDLLIWLEHSLGERSGRWELAVLSPVSPEGEVAR